MKNEIEELIHQLQRLDNIEEFDDILLADMLWLALSMDEVQREKEKKSKVDFLLWLKNWLNSFFRNEKEQVSTDKKESSSNTTKILYNDGVPLTLNSSSLNSQEKIRVPKKKEFFVSDELIKSFSALKKGHASIESGRVLDEELTVDYIAKTNIVKPHFEALSENYFDLYLMIDTSESMEIWQDSIDVFVEKLRVHSFFRTLKLLYLDTRTTTAKVYKNKEQTNEFSSHLYNYEKRSLLFILSDCIAPAWKHGDFLYRVYEYNEKIPTTLINMLPKRMWHGTILGNANETKIHALKESPTNNHIESDVAEEYHNEELLKLPVVNWNVKDFKSLSHFIVGKKENRCTGLVANKEEMLYKDEEKITELSSEQRVKRFFKNSSPEAHKLALYLSVTTHLNFPIMKMIQHNMLESSNQIHLAEVFVGGLLNKSKENDFYLFMVDKNSISVRNILLEKLGDYKAMATLQKNSEFIAQNLGSSLDFTALLHSDFEDGEWSDADKVFANIARSVLQKIGGNYSKIASKITTKIDAEEEEETVTLITPTTKRFIMGSKDGRDEEKPAHEVIINYDFEMAQTPITVGEFRVFVEETNYKTEAEKGDGAYVYDGEDWVEKKDASWKNPYFEQTDENPVVCVSWNDAQAYIKWLNEKTNEIYRLPTEAEWEFACRAGTQTKWHFGDDEKELDKYAWYRKNSYDLGKEHKNFGTNPVGKKLPNQWGLYDMHGNVLEWCLDDFVDNYNNTPRDGSFNEKGEKKYKSLRGGSWVGSASDTRSADRVWFNPASRDVDVGFRLLRTLP